MMKKLFSRRDHNWYEKEIRGYIREYLKIREYDISRDQDNALITWAYSSSRLNANPVEAALYFALKLYQDFLCGEYEERRAAKNLLQALHLEIRVAEGRGDVSPQGVKRLMEKINSIHGSI